MANASLVVRLSAQIAEFQRSFDEAAKTTQKFQDGFQESATKASAMGNLIAQGAAKGIGALTDLGKAVLDNASNIQDMAFKTGLSMKTIQEFQFVAEQTGTTADVFANAALRLGVAVAGITKPTDGAAMALNKLGLSYKEMQALSPDEQFNKTVDALSRMENVQERNRLAQELFGARAKDILPALNEGYRKLADGATIASDQQIIALDAAGDAWARFKTNAISHMTGAVGGIIMGFERIQKEGFWEFTEAIAKSGGNFGVVLAQMAADAQREANKIKNTMKDVLLAAPTAAVNTDYVKVLNDAKNKVNALSTAQRAQLAAAQALGTETATLTSTFGLNAAELRVLGSETKAHTKDVNAQESAAEKAAAKLKAYGESVQKLTDDLSGTQTADVKKLQDAFDRLTDEQLKNEDVQRRVAAAAGKLRDEGAKLSPELDALATRFSNLTLRTSNFGEAGFDVFENVQDWTVGFDRFKDSLVRADAALVNFGEQGFDQFENTKPFDMVMDAALKPFDEAKKRLATFKDDLKDIALDGAHTFAVGIAEGIETGDWGAAGQAFEDAMGQMMSKGMAAAVDFFVPGLGKALGPIFDAISKKITSAFDFNEGRDLVQDFAKSFGGFDALHVKLNELGAAGEQLWIKLTQGVGRDNPQQAKAAIDAITAAFGESVAKTQLLSEAMREYGFTWADLGAAGRAEQLSSLLTDLKAKTDVLIGAGIDELSVLQKQESQYEDLLVKAIATNTEIPLAMRPLLERMQELGLLTDEATGQFIDLGQVTWAKSLTQGFDQVTKAIYDLRDALTKGVGGALDDLGRKSVRIPIGFDIENPPKGVPALASGGIVRRPTLALVGEAGPEAVIPLSSMGSAGGGDQTIILEMDGRAVARVVVPLIPGEVRRYGLVS